MKNPKSTTMLELTVRVEVEGDGEVQKRLMLDHEADIRHEINFALLQKDTLYYAIGQVRIHKAGKYGREAL